MPFFQKSSIGFGLLLVMLQGFLFFVLSPLFASEIHVSPTGFDEHSGSAQAPVLTLEKGRGLARIARNDAPDEPVTIWLHPGSYMIRKNIEFTAECAQVGAMHLHNARENHIYNNVFANNAGPRGATRQLSLQGWNDSPTGLFVKARQDRLVRCLHPIEAVSPDSRQGLCPFLQHAFVRRRREDDRALCVGEPGTLEGVWPEDIQFGGR